MAENLISQYERDSILTDDASNCNDSEKKSTEKASVGSRNYFSNGNSTSSNLRSLTIYLGVILNPMKY